MKPLLLARSLLVAMFLLAAQLGFADDLPLPGLAKPPQAPKVQPPAPPACGAFAISQGDIGEVAQYLDISQEQRAWILQLLLNGCEKKGDGDGANVTCTLKTRSERQGKIFTLLFEELGGRVTVNQEPLPVVGDEWASVRASVAFAASALCVQARGVAPRWVIWKKSFNYEHELDEFILEPGLGKGVAPRYLFANGNVSKIERTIEKSPSGSGKVLLDQLKHFDVPVVEFPDGNSFVKANRYARARVHSWFKSETEMGTYSLRAEILSHPQIKAFSLAPNLVTALELSSDKKRSFLNEKGVSKRWDDLRAGKVAMDNRERAIHYFELYREVIDNQTVAEANNAFHALVYDYMPRPPKKCYTLREFVMNGKTQQFFYPHQRGIVSDPLLLYGHNDPALMRLLPCT